MLWVLFGPSVDAGFLDSHHYYYFVPAEPLTWSQQRIDLRGVYEQLGWSLPPLEQMRRNDIQLLARPLSIRLLLAGRAQPEVISAQFGPIAVDVAEQAIRNRVADTIAYRWEYYFLLSDLSAENRNEQLADTYFEIASEDAPAGAGDFVLAERAFSNEDYDAAIAHFEQAITHDYRTTEAKRGIGWSLAALGNLDEAERYFTAALADNAVFADAYTGLGTIWMQRGQCDRAVGYSRQALAITPDASGPLQIMQACSGQWQGAAGEGSPTR
jgi:tetratricopeptide (TPR) repeat protein